MTVEIICADAREALAAMPDGSVHTCITSPPYWGLRDYGLEPVVWGDAECGHEWGEESYQRRSNDGGDPNRKQETNAGALGRDEPIYHAFCRRCSAWRGSLGLEPTPELYVEHIVQVMREVRRVLRDDGTLWLNLGDSYAGSQKGIGADGTAYGGAKQRTNSGSMGLPVIKDIPGLKPKDLVGIPWRVAFALQADGWWLRSDIVWSKPNPMPESVTDRPTRSHEYLFLLSKSARYYYDQDAIQEPAKNPEDDIRRIEQQHEKNKSAATAERGGLRVRKSKMPDGWATHKGNHGTIHQDGREAGAPTVIPAGRNKRSVWEIATQPYAKAHFATFPEKLVEPCILAGTSEWGCCPECGAPWERMVEKGKLVPDAPGYKPRGAEHPRDGFRAVGMTVKGDPHGSAAPNHHYERIDKGWCPTCDHEGEPAPCTVMDPFAGSGTVGLVAERLGRHSVLIDANEDYVKMARERTAQMGLMVEAAR